MADIQIDHDQIDEADNSKDASKRKVKKNRPWVRPLIVIVVLVILVGGAFWGWQYWTVGRFFQSTNDAYLQADQTAVAPKVQGYVSAVFVDANQEVAAGAQLVKIDDSDYRAKVNQADAGVEASRADLARAQAEAKRQVTAVGQSEAQLASSKTQAAFAQSQVERYQPLAKTGAATDEQMSNLISQRDQANAQVATSQASLASAKEAINTANAAIVQAQAALKQSQAQLAQAQLDLDATLIVAPISGRAGDKTVAVGQYVQPGTRLMTLVPVKDIYLEANFKETQVELMRVGQPCVIKVDTIGSEDLHGVVESFSPGTGSQFSLIPPENATGNFTKIVQRVPVRIRVDAGPEARKVLVPGLSVTVDVDTRGARDEARKLKDEGKAREEAK